MGSGRVTRGIRSDRMNLFFMEDIDELLLDLGAIFIHFCKTACREHHMPDTLFCHFAYRLRTLLGRKNDDGEIDPFRQGTDGRINGKTQKLSPFRVDEIDFTGKLIRLNISDHLMARFARSERSADDRYGPGGKETDPVISYQARDSSCAVGVYCGRSRILTSSAVIPSSLTTKGLISTDS